MLCILSLFYLSLAGAWNLPSGQHCCNSLKQSLNDIVSFPGAQIYEQEQNGNLTNYDGYWSLQESSLRPACRVTPLTPQDVSTAVKILVDGHCQFAVRSGGHTSFAGAANIDCRGVTIDLSALDHVIVSTDNSTVQVGPGARWGDVYTSLEPYNLGVAGGRVSSVGVGGLTLGGGKSFFQSIYGFACDNTEKFEVVLANGSIVTTSATNQPDLFKALKGGSNNFGIVTSFSLRTFPLTNIWAGQNVYPANTASHQYQALTSFVASQGQNDSAPTADASIIAAYVVNNQSSFFANFLSYTEPTPWPPAFENYTPTAFPSIYSSARISTLRDFGQELVQGTPNGLRYIFGTATFKPDYQFLMDLRNESEKLFQPFLAKVPQIMISTVFQPLTKAMLRAGCGENSLGLCPDDGNLMLLDLTVSWNSTSDMFDRAINEASYNLVGWTQSESKKRGLFHPYEYLNYALQGQDPIGSYGQENVKFLEKVSGEVDPSGVFQRLVRGGFKIQRGGRGRDGGWGGHGGGQSGGWGHGGPWSGGH